MIIFNVIVIGLEASVLLLFEILFYNFFENLTISSAFFFEVLGRQILDILYLYSIFVYCLISLLFVFLFCYSRYFIKFLQLCFFISAHVIWKTSFCSAHAFYIALLLFHWFSILLYPFEMLNIYLLKEFNLLTAVYLILPCSLLICLSGWWLFSC